MFIDSEEGEENSPSGVCLCCGNIGSQMKTTYLKMFNSNVKRMSTGYQQIFLNQKQHNCDILIINTGLNVTLHLHRISIVT